VDRMACINLPALPLQLLLGRHPDWVSHPAAVVDHDRPQGLILWVNERALSCRVRPGMRYAAGLALSGDLHAGVVPPKEIEEAVASIATRLRYFSPKVEPSGGAYRTARHFPAAACRRAHRGRNDRTLRQSSASVCSHTRSNPSTASR
jgi:hypothetical protein